MNNIQLRSCISKMIIEHMCTVCRPSLIIPKVCCSKVFFKSVRYCDFQFDKIALQPDFVTFLNLATKALTSLKETPALKKKHHIQQCIRTGG